MGEMTDYKKAREALRALGLPVAELMAIQEAPYGTKKRLKVLQIGERSKPDLRIAFDLQGKFVDFV